MKQDDVRVLNDKELEEVSGGMLSENRNGANETCPFCGQPVHSCTCTEFHLGSGGTQLRA